MKINKRKKQKYEYTYLSKKSSDKYSSRQLRQSHGWN